jgi:hypothetical protein
MKRLHVHVSVDDLAQSIRFYSVLFAAEPTVLKDDYAKWMLDDPRVNFAISTGCRPAGHAAGFSHLGIQAEDETELAEVYGRLCQAERPIVEQTATTCCYAKSDKAVDRRPPGCALGNLPHPGRSNRPRRQRLTCEAQGSDRARCLLRTVNRGTHAGGGGYRRLLPAVLLRRLGAACGQQALQSPLP